ncbi:hypothetical protein N8524_11585, partial [Candidatus Puniceispirillum sp.]|nr:hypothetical protein [Candidatus Puniceispirillum sp.]
MMTRVLLTVLVGLLLSLGTSAAFADTFACKRYTDDSFGFTTYSVFESWFPKRISLEIYGWKSRSGYKALTKEEKDRKYRLLPNGKMIAGMKPKPGFKTVDNVRYKCDRTSLQLTAGLERKGAGTSVNSSPKFTSINDRTICNYATYETGTIGNYFTTWVITKSHQQYVQEAKRRGLSCGVGETTQTATVSKTKSNGEPEPSYDFLSLRWKDMNERQRLCLKATTTFDGVNKWDESITAYNSVNEAKRRGLSCGVSNGVNNGQIQLASDPHNLFSGRHDVDVCRNVNVNKDAKQEAIRRGLTCGVGETTQAASAPVPKAKPKATSAALTAAEKEAERLRQELAALKAKQQQQQQQTISNDTQVPLITITQLGADGRKGSVKGYAKDNV